MLWLICFFNYADRQAIFSVFPLLQRELGLSTIQLGLLGSSFAWVYGLSGPFAGWFVDRVPRRNAILGGLQFWSIVCALSAASRTFPQLLFFRAAEGLGESLYYPASTSLVSDYHGPRTRSRALGFLVTSVYAGTVGGGLWAGAMAERFGWRLSFLVLGGLGSALGVCLLWYLREVPRGSAEGNAFETLPPSLLMTLGLLIKTPAALLLMLAFVCANFVALVLLSWMPTYLYANFHLSLAKAAFVATVYPQSGSMLGAFVGGWAADKMANSTAGGRALTQAAGVLIGAPCVFLCGRADTLTMCIATLLIWGFAKGIYDANIFASVFDVMPAEVRGTTSGVMNCAGWMLGGGAAPLVIGILSRRIGLGNAIASSASVYFLAVILLAAAAAIVIRKSRCILAD
ncbi:MFS transporter [soil metagenome]